MIEPARFALFVAASWALILAPGPDMLYVITRRSAHGPRAGIVSAIGVICGILVHTAAAAFGFAAVLQASTLAFRMVKYFGAAYLIYLGFRTWQEKSSFDLHSSIAGASFGSLFWQGLLSNLLNPKIAIFFLAFLQQFVDPASPQIPLQMGILGLTFASLGLCFLAAAGYSAGIIGRWLSRQPSQALFLQRSAGGILIGLGASLGLMEH